MVRPRNSSQGWLKKSHALSLPDRQIITGAVSAIDAEPLLAFAQGVFDPSASDALNQQSGNQAPSAAQDAPVAPTM